MWTSDTTADFKRYPGARLRGAAGIHAAYPESYCRFSMDPGLRRGDVDCWREDVAADECDDIVDLTP